MMRKLLQFTVVRIVLAILFVALPLAGVQLLVISAAPGNDAYALLGSLGGGLVAWLGYLLYVRLIERRPCTELALAAAPGQLAGGLLLGALLFTATIGVLWLAGAYAVTGTGPWTNMILSLAVALGAGLFEEILFRGILFRLIEQSLGTWLALAITAIGFGAIHLANPGASWVSGLAIVLEAGILLAATYMLTRRLWLPIGTHVAWNFVQGGIFGVAVSGRESKGWLLGELSGPSWLSGGAFGAEASLAAIMICLGAAIVFIVKAHRRNHIVQPFWRRQAIVSAAELSPQTR